MSDQNRLLTRYRGRDSDRIGHATFYDPQSSMFFSYSRGAARKRGDLVPGSEPLTNELAPRPATRSKYDYFHCGSFQQ